MAKKEGFNKAKKISKKEIEESLVENFINLQKVLTNLSAKFEDLSNNISKILQLFEISAKSFAEKYSGESASQTDTDKDFLAKLDSLLEQNKIIAKGIMLMEDKIRERGSPQNISMQQAQEMPERIGREPLRRSLTRY